MSGIELAQLTVLVVFAVNSVLLGSLIVLKAVHHRRMEGHARRKERYVALLSRHVAFTNCTDPITTDMTDDPAFLDALIDVRNAVSGPEVDTIHGIVDRYGIVERQVARLKSPFPLGRRLRAAVALAEIGDESAVPALIEHLDDREPEIRIQCARGLSRIGWTPGIDAIIERFGYETTWVRTRFADTLTSYGRRATSPLIAYIRVNHRHEHEGPALAIRTLGTIGDDQAVEPLLEILEDALDPEIAIAAIETLGILASPLAIPPLLVRMGSNDWRIRAKSATALGEIGHPSAVPALVQALHDTNWWVRRNSAAALAKTGEGIEMLYEALGDEDPFAADAAAEALVDIGQLAHARDAVARGVDTIGERFLVEHMVGTISP